jgi:hypothetical protein
MPDIVNRIDKHLNKHPKMEYVGKLKGSYEAFIPLKKLIGLNESENDETTKKTILGCFNTLYNLKDDKMADSFIQKLSGVVKPIAEAIITDYMSSGKDMLP